MKTLLSIALLAFAAPAAAQSAPEAAHAHHAEMDHSAHAQLEKAAPSGCTEEHAAMGHCTLDAPEAKAACEGECCTSAECTMDCREAGECKMEGSGQCEEGKDCCAGMAKSDHTAHHGAHQGH